MSYLDALKVAQAENSEKHAIQVTDKTDKTRFCQFWQFPSTHVLPEFGDAGEPEPPPEPDRHDRRCYLCASFTRSPYGFPLGLCQQHGDRIQHATSQPAQFGCISFQLRAPDTNFCTTCRHYHPDSAMCRVVNTGCPYPAIPPCTGAHFEPKEVEA